MNKFFPSGIQTQNNNIETQTFDPNLTHNVSMVSGFDGVHENLAIVDASGNLHVNSAASSYLHYYSNYLSISTPYVNTVNVVLPAVASLIFIQIGTNPANVAFVDTTTGQLGIKISLSPGTYMFPIVTSGLAVYAFTSGSGTFVTVMSFY